MIHTTSLGRLSVLESTQTKTAFKGGRALIDSVAETVLVRLLNPCSEPTTVYKGTRIATFVEVSKINTYVAAVRPSKQASQTTKHHQT